MNRFQSKGRASKERGKRAVKKKNSTCNSLNQGICEDDEFSWQLTRFYL